MEQNEEGQDPTAKKNPDPAALTNEHTTQLYPKDAESVPCKNCWDIVDPVELARVMGITVDTEEVFADEIAGIGYYSTITDMKLIALNAATSPEVQRNTCASLLARYLVGSKTYIAETYADGHDVDPQVHNLAVWLMDHTLPEPELLQNDEKLRATVRALLGITELDDKTVERGVEFIASALCHLGIETETGFYYNQMAAAVIKIYNTHKLFVDGPGEI